MTRAELLTAALDAVNKRPKAYGPPEQNFERIAGLWNEYAFGKYGGEEFLFNAVDVACMMVLMKVARLEETPDHIDSWTDIAGYAACGAEVCGATDDWIAVPKGEPFPSDLKAGDRIRLKGVGALEGEALEGEGTYRIVIPDGEYGARDTYRGASVTLASRRRPRWYKRAEST